MRKVALLGNGDWGKILKRYLESSTLFNLTSIYSRTIKEEKGTNDFEDVLNSNVEAVFIALPPELLAQYTKKCLEAGKHVFCEKPLSSDPKVVKMLFELAAANKVNLYVNYIYTLSPSINYIKENIESIGPIKSIKLRLNQYGKFYDNQNSFETVGCHLLSTFFYWFPSIGLSQLKFEILRDLNDHNDILLKAESPNYCIEFESNLLSEEKDRLFHVLGEKGSLSFTPLEKVSITHKVDEKVKEYSFNELDNIANSLNHFSMILDKKIESNDELCHKVSVTLELIKKHGKGR